VTVKVTSDPATTEVGSPVTASRVRPAWTTRMPAWVPLMAAPCGNPVCVAVSDCVPAVVRVASKTCVPASAAVKA
jgi:hypothetical protein